MLPSPRSAVLLGLVLYLSFPALAQAPVLVKDINLTPKPDPGSNPQGFAALGGSIYFAATRPDVGTELFVTTGQPGTVELFADIDPGPASSDPSEITVAGNRLFFRAGDGTGDRLWVSDGTTAGTQPLLAATLSSPHDITVVGSTLFFAGTTPAQGEELWSSDGTTAGTTMVADINPGAASSTPESPIAFGNELLFVAHTGPGPGLWRSDGSAAGTQQVQAFPASAFPSPEELVAVGSTAFFAVYEPFSQVWELWSTDGTKPGTVLVRPGFSDISETTAFQDQVFFRGGLALWKSDGTAPGTVIVAAGVEAELLAAAGNTLFFRDGASTYLWASDGTPGGTAVVSPNLFIGPEIVAVGSLVAFRGFTVPGLPGGIELWKSNGTAPGTEPVADPWPGASSSSPSNLVAIGSQLFFAAEPSPTGPEPATSDLTTAGTMMLGDIYTLGTVSSSPSDLIDFYGQTLFAADDGSSGRELWRTDGTLAGTFLLADIWAGPSAGSPTGFVIAGNTAFFSATTANEGTEVWKTDGTAAGTQLVKDIRPGQPGSGFPTSAAVVGSTIYFPANDGVNGTELWKTDGTASGTILVENIASGAGSSSPANLTAVGSLVLFTVSSPSSQLWRSDGTAAGTFVLGSISLTSPRPVAAYKGELFLGHNEPGFGWELWRTDGTLAGTALVKDIWPGSGSGYPTWLTVVGDTLFFVATDPTRGYELWKSDGTAGGTVQVKDITPGSSSTFPQDLAASGPVLVFEDNDRDLWSSDGTESGTQLITSFSGGTALGAFTTVGSRKEYFTVTDPGLGNELWVTGGTTGNTRLVANLNAGSASSNPVWITHSNGRVLFAADDGNLGSELWTVDPGATAQPVGVSCANAAQMLRLDSLDPILGAVATVTGAGAVPGTAGFLVLGLPFPALALAPGGCFLYLHPATIALLAQINAVTSSWSTPIPLPNVPFLLGLRVGLQAVLGPTATPLGADLTNAVVWTLGY